MICEDTEGKESQALLRRKVTQERSTGFGIGRNRRFSRRASRALGPMLTRPPSQCTHLSVCLTNWPPRALLSTAHSSFWSSLSFPSSSLPAPPHHASFLHASAVVIVGAGPSATRPAHLDQRRLVSAGRNVDRAPFARAPTPTRTPAPTTPTRLAPSSLHHPKGGADAPFLNPTAFCRPRRRARATARRRSLFPPTPLAARRDRSRPAHPRCAGLPAALRQQAVCSSCPPSHQTLSHPRRTTTINPNPRRPRRAPPEHPRRSPERTTTRRG